MPAKVVTSSSLRESVEPSDTWLVAVATKRETETDSETEWARFCLKVGERDGELLTKGVHVSIQSTKSSSNVVDSREDK